MTTQTTPEPKCNAFGTECTYQTVEAFIAARIEPLASPQGLEKCRKDIGAGDEFHAHFHPFKFGTPERYRLYAALKKKAAAIGWEWNDHGRGGYVPINPTPTP